MSVGKICFSTDSLKSSVTTLLIKAELGLRNLKVLVFKREKLAHSLIQRNSRKWCKHETTGNIFHGHKI